MGSNNTDSGFAKQPAAQLSESSLLMRKNWKKTTIADLIKSENASLQTGPFGTALKASEYATEGVPLISVREIRNGYFELTEHTPYVNEKTLSRLPKFILRYGDIVFGRKGAVKYMD